jgi:hypothetical protein
MSGQLAEAVGLGLVTAPRRTTIEMLDMERSVSSIV